MYGKIGVFVQTVCRIPSEARVLLSLRGSKSCRNRPKQCLTNLDHSNAKKTDPIGLHAMIKLTSVNYILRVLYEILRVLYEILRVLYENLQVLYGI